MDDVSTDVWQRDARAVDLGLACFAPVTLALVAAARQGVLQEPALSAVFQLKPFVAVAISLRIILPFADVLSFSDFTRGLLPTPPSPPAPKPSSEPTLPG